MGKKTTTDRNKKRKRSAKDAHLKAALEEWSKANGTFKVDLHSHSTCSDGLLSPEQLVERASKRGVRVLALTDHDTMAGVPAAISAARKHGIRIIPGVEISTRFMNSSGNLGESIHILAFYGCCGPAQGLEEKLKHIREGRFDRARSMVEKLQELKKPVRWESVLAIAGPGVAPGRPHIARALHQAGLVGSVGEAFNKFIGDDGPAYATGFELPAAEAVRLIIQTGGVAVLAHPWSLKKPLDVVQQLKNAGLHAMEVYKSSGRDKGFAALADAHNLVKLGGSDFHGTGAVDETDLGKVEVPVNALHEFLAIAGPLWSSSLKQIVSSFAAGKANDDGGGTLERFYGDAEVVSNELKLSSWLSDGEKETIADHAASLGLTYELQETNPVLRKGKTVVDHS